MLLPISAAAITRVAAGTNRATAAVAAREHVPVVIRLSFLRVTGRSRG